MGQVEDMFRSMQDAIERSVRQKLDGLAKQILERALYYRSQLVALDIGHNYTGNFVNSIGVGIYIYGNFQRGYYASQEIGKAPVMGKMTTLKSGGPRKYTFVVEAGRPDFQGGESSYTAKIKTDMRTVNKGMVEEVLKSIHPRNKNGYSIILAYSVEYAEFIENLRASTGFALVEDEFCSKAKEIQKYFTEDATLGARDSELTSNTWDKIIANNAAQGDEGAAEDSLALMKEQGKSVHLGNPSENPYIWFTPFDGEPLDIKPNNPGQDPLGGGFDNNLPF